MYNTYSFSVSFGIPEGTALKFWKLQCTFLEVQLQAVGHSNATFSLANNDIMISPGGKNTDWSGSLSYPDVKFNFVNTDVMISLGGKIQTDQDQFHIPMLNSTLQTLI